LALSAINQLAREFDVDELAEQAAALGVIQREMKTSADALKLEGYYNKTIAALSEAHRYDQAGKLAEELSALGQRIRDVPLRNRAIQNQIQIEARKLKWDAGIPIEELLSREVKVPKEHDLVGRHFAFTLGQWKTGLAHLARSDNAELAALAMRDLNGPDGPAEQAALGDSWRLLAEGRPDSPEKSVIQRHAADWYLRAERNFTGTDRAVFTDKLRELSEIADLLSQCNPESSLHHGDWKIENGALISPAAAWSRIQPAFVPPDEYLVTLEAEWLRHQNEPVSGRDALLVGLSHAGRQFMVALDWSVQNPDKPHVTGFIELDRFFSWSPLTSYCHFSPPVLKRGQKNLIEISVRRTGVTVTVNGEQLVQYEEDYARLGTGTWFSGVEPDKLFVGTHYASYRFSRFEVRRIPQELP
jgi:hypothetical protein